MKNINITEAEWTIMRILWSRHPLTLKEIVALVDEDWTYTTTRTLVSRLEKKNALKADKTEAVFKYTPAVNEESCKMSEAQSLLNRVFDNSVSSLVMSLVSSENLSKKEYDELIRLIDKMDRSDDK